MEYNEFDSRFKHFQVRSMMGYMRLTKLLLRLELPINMEPLTADSTPTELVESATIARKALQDMPMDMYLQATLGTALLDWMCGIALAAAAAGDDDVRWAIEGALLLTVRASDEMDLAEDLLDGNIDLTDAPYDEE
ncbi:hypothetical protein [Nocardia brasiliensis]|uniref:hypothetical protein n=1 Tax=Nocardia brasiliensis TaxID=37326 RepID=UPI00366FA6ED